MPKRRRKNFFPTLVLIFFFWTILVLIFFYVEPGLIRDFLIPGLYLPFFFILFWALFFTLAIIFINSRRGLIFSLGFIIFLLLRLNGLGNLLNAFLILALIIALDYHFTRSR